MSLVVNSNISSLNAQRQLSSSGAELDKASERLASGRRINSAADDAAGLAISNRQTSQIRGLDQAIRNANDGISLIQTAEGALDETTNILQRMRELAVQSANGIYSDADRSTLDAEVQQLKAEITRIAESTSFNGAKLLDGSLGKVDLQVGAMANQTIGFEIGKLDAKGLGGGAAGDVVGTAMGGTIAAAVALVDGTAAGGTIEINGQSVGDLTGVTTMKGLIDTVNSNVSGVKVSAFTEVTATAEGTGLLRGANTLNLSMVDAEGRTQSYVIGETGSMNELVDKINSVTGGAIGASLDDNGRLRLTNEAGGVITSSYGGTATAASTGLTAGTYNASLSFEITDPSVKNVDISIVDTTGQADITAISNAFGIQARTGSDITGNLGTTAIAAGNIVEGDISINGVKIGAVEAGGAGGAAAGATADAINLKSAETGVVASVDADNRLHLNSVSGKEISVAFSESAHADIRTMTGLLETNNASSIGNSVADVNVSTAAGAQKAIGTIDTALEQINDARSQLGAVNNRLDFTVANLSNVMENTSAARSRIVDADFAAETAALSRSQVLQQASQAMLAQANARPQQVLSLLQ